MRSRQVVRMTVRDRVIPVVTRHATPRDTVILFPSVGEYPVYDDRTYAAFSDCPVRNAAYSHAITTLARGRTALDIGTGRDALWAIACAQAGARRVYAVEEMPDIADQARKAVADVGLSDVVTVLTGNSRDVVLPEPAELCVSEIVGTIASSEGAAAVLRDAHERLCQPDAVFVPDRCVTRIAAASLGDLPEQQHLAVLPESLPYLRSVFALVGHPFDIRLCVAGRPADLLISNTGEVEQLAFGTTTPTHGRVCGVLRITRDAPLHGFLLWINLWCLPGDEPYDSLAMHDPGWVPVYAPVSTTGIDVTAGDLLEYGFTSELSDDGRHPDYRLSVAVIRQDGDDTRVEWASAHHAPRFRASAPYRDLFPPSA